MREIDFFLALANFTKHVKAGESAKRHVQLAKEKKLCYYEVRRKWEEAPICILE
jgi:hypothetical protein|nr:hypothetical protein [uncultured Faecalimonas sp.]